MAGFFLGAVWDTLNGPRLAVTLWENDMIKIAPLDQIHGDVIVWRCVKRLGDFTPTDGAEYVVQKTRNAAPLIYRAANGKLRSTGDTLARWGFFDGPDDVIRVPARGRKS